MIYLYICIIMLFIANPTITDVFTILLMRNQFSNQIKELNWKNLWSSMNCVFDFIQPIAIIDDLQSIWIMGKPQKEIFFSLQKLKMLFICKNNILITCVRCCVACYRSFRLHQNIIKCCVISFVFNKQKCIHLTACIGWKQQTQILGKYQTIHSLFLYSKNFSSLNNNNMRSTRRWWVNGNDNVS